MGKYGGLGGGRVRAFHTPGLDTLHISQMGVRGVCVCVCVCVRAATSVGLACSFYAVTLLFRTPNTHRISSANSRASLGGHAFPIWCMPLDHVL